MVDVAVRACTYVLCTQFSYWIVLLSCTILLYAVQGGLYDCAFFYLCRCLIACNGKIIQWPFGPFFADVQYRHALPIYKCVTARGFERTLPRILTA